MNRTLLAVVAVLLVACSSIAYSAPPYDVEVTVEAPITGGAVDGYTLYVNDAEVGPVTEGINLFSELLTADGTYTFRVDATNAAGTTPGDSVTVTVNALSLPGTTTIQIQVDCDPCVTTYQ